MAHLGRFYKTPYDAYRGFTKKDVIAPLPATFQQKYNRFLNERFRNSQLRIISKRCVYGNTKFDPG